MKNKNSLILSILLSVLWSSCVITNESPIKISASPNSITEKPISLSTATVSVELTSLPVSIDTDISLSIPICPKSGIQTSPSDNFGIPGTIVYQKGFQGIYTVGGIPLTYSKLPVDEGQENFAFGFSPNGEWFAFSPLEYTPTNETVFESPKIVLLSANGERIETSFSVEDFADELPVGFRLIGFSGYSHWINSTTIYAALYSGTMTSTSAGTIDDLPKVLDPFAGVWREDLLKDLPEGAKSFPKGISPDMTRMLYMGGDGLFLKDWEKGVDIWHNKDLFAGFGALMFWSPDSETVAYANLYDSPESRTVVLISRDGRAKPIMGPTLSLSELLVMDLRWSPDGRYLALLAWKEEGKELSVFIYDFEAEKYISQCPIAKYTSRGAKLIWSPNNKYLAYAALDYPLIIMDVESGETIKLADGARAVGWSDKFPVTWP